MIYYIYLDFSIFQIIQIPSEMIILGWKVMNSRILELGDVYNIPLQKHQNWCKEKAFGKIWSQSPHGLVADNIQINI